MSSLDYRTVIEKTLPDLARQLGGLIRPIGDGYGGFVHYIKHHGHYGKHPQAHQNEEQWSWRAQADFDKPFHRTVRDAGDGKHEYVYSPQRKHGDWYPGGHQPDVADECYVIFRNLRVVRIVDQEYGPLDTVATGPPHVATKSYPNDSPEPTTKELESAAVTWTEWGKDWEVAVESEFSTTIKAGSELYGVESETSFKLSASYAQAGSTSGGEEKSESDKTSTIIKPYHRLDVVQKRQPVRLSQDIKVTGELEVDITWGLARCFEERSTSLRGLLDVFRGLGAQNGFLTEWFSHPEHCPAESVLEAIRTPVVTIDLGISDVPADQVEITTRQRPLRDEAE